MTLTNLAIAAIAGIALNAILPGKDYEFGSDVTEGRSGDFGRLLITRAAASAAALFRPLWSYSFFQI